MIRRDEYEQARELQGRLMQYIIDQPTTSNSGVRAWYSAQAARWWFASWLRERAVTYASLAKAPEIGTVDHETAARVLRGLADELDPDRQAIKDAADDTFVKRIRGES